MSSEIASPSLGPAPASVASSGRILYQHQKPFRLDPGSLRLRALIDTCCATRPAATLSRPAVNPSF
jgi:hypothetical protein